MHKFIVLLGGLMVMATGPVWAENSLAQRVSDLEARIGQSWTEKVKISGALEVEASFTDGEGETASDIDLTSVELGIDVTPSERLSAFALLKWEDDENNVFIDEGGLVLGNTEEMSLTLGKLYLPFGVFETALISDPLTLELGETREGAAVIDLAAKGGYGSIYVYNSELDKPGDDDEIDAFGVTLGYVVETETITIDFSAGYISNITSSGGFTDVLDTIDGQSAGAALSVVANWGATTLIGEYIQVLDNDYSAGDNSEPGAWVVEISRAFTLGSHAAYVAATYQESDQAEIVELAETRYGAVFGYEIAEGLGLAFEYLRNQGYDDSDEDVLTGQLALEF